METAQEDGTDAVRYKFDTLQRGVLNKGSNKLYQGAPTLHSSTMEYYLFAFLLFNFPLTGTKQVPYQQLKCMQLLLTLVKANLAILWTFTWHLPEALDLHLPPTLPFPVVHST